MNSLHRLNTLITRRQFFGRTAAGIGVAALASLLNPSLFAAESAPAFGPRGRCVRCNLLPRPSASFTCSCRAGLRTSICSITSRRSRSSMERNLPASDPNGAAHHGDDFRAGVVSRASRRCFNSRSTASADAGSASCCRIPPGSWMRSRSSSRSTPRRSITIPATTFIQTGSQQPGRPSLGAWLSYGLGSENSNLPAFVVMISQGSGNKTDQPIFSRLWGSGFLPSEHQGVRLRSGADPVLYLSNPPGIDRRFAPRDDRRDRRPESHGREIVRRSGNQHAHRPIRDGVSHAELGARN